jgi:exosome complex RNA-binding protein Rrp4
MEATKGKRVIWVFAKKGPKAKIHIALPNGLKINKIIGKATQAQADHMALQEAMDLALGQNGKVIILTESALIDGIINRKWKIKNNEDLSRKTKKRYKNLKEKITIKKISKKENLARNME